MAVSFTVELTISIINAATNRALKLKANDVNTVIQDVMQHLENTIETTDVETIDLTQKDTNTLNLVIGFEHINCLNKDIVDGVASYEVDVLFNAKQLFVTEDKKPISSKVGDKSVFFSVKEYKFIGSSSSNEELEEEIIPETTNSNKDHVVIDVKENVNNMETILEKVEEVVEASVNVTPKKKGGRTKKSDEEKKAEKLRKAEEKRNERELAKRQKILDKLNEREAKREEMKELKKQQRKEEKEYLNSLSEEERNAEIQAKKERILLERQAKKEAAEENKRLRAIKAASKVPKPAKESKLDILKRELLNSSIELENINFNNYIDMVNNDNSTRNENDIAILDCVFSFLGIKNKSWENMCLEMARMNANLKSIESNSVIENDDLDARIKDTQGRIRASKKVNASFVEDAPNMRILGLWLMNIINYLNTKKRSLAQKERAEEKKKLVEAIKNEKKEAKLSEAQRKKEEREMKKAEAQRKREIREMKRKEREMKNAAVNAVSNAIHSIEESISQ